ncbi:MAG TPA: hypothetical protein VH370_05120 [Humisphaera sp.]|jgi:hypothetical protein|nr:hypothetical protein [Humisphaera sp.]
MNGIKQGNTISDGAAHKGWLIGRFIDEDPMRQTHEVEVKWGIHKAGETNRGFAADQVARSMSVLIRGRFRLTFRRGNVTEEILLEKEGDYAMWLPGVEHTWAAEAEGETVILTVRWPSLPYQQVERR